MDIDLGLHTWVRKETLRFYRINAAELRGSERPDGLKSRDFLRDKIQNKEVVIETIKDKKGKYGRYLAEIWLKDKNGKYSNINDIIVKEGFEVYKDY